MTGKIPKWIEEKRDELAIEYSYDGCWDAINKSMYRDYSSGFNAAAEIMLEREKIAVDALRFYGSDEAWNIEQVEGSCGDYGNRARGALAKLRGEDAAN